MIATQTISLSIRLLFLSVRIAAWCAETIWIGAIGCCRALLFAFRVPRVFAKSVRCPRGHRVDLYGVHRCGRCQAAFEGHAFDPCHACGARAHYFACLRCGLAVHDPAK
jgi:hypothetical protein